MLTLIKWIVGALLTLGMLVVIAAVVVPRVVDPNDYRETVTKLVKEQTGRDLVLQGDLSISVFPWLGVRTQGLSFSQPSQFAQNEAPMLEVETAQLRVKFLPLLSRRMEIDTIVLERPTLNFITLSDGVDSFFGLGASSETVPDGQATEVSDSALAAALVIQGINITNGAVVWDDRQAKQKYTIRELNLVSGNLIGDALADFEISGIIIDQSDPQELSLSSRGQARIDKNSLEIVAKSINADISQAGQSIKLLIESLAIDQAQNVVAKGIKMSGGLKGVQADSLNLQYDGVLTSAELNSDKDELTLTALKTNLQTKMSDQPDVEFSLETPKLVLDLEAQRLLTKSLSLNGKVGDRPVVLSMTDLNADLLKQTASATQFQLRSKDLDAKVTSFRATQIFDMPEASGKITTAPFNAAQALRDFEVDYVAADESALRSVTLDADFTAGMDKLDFKDMKLKLDQSQVNGQFSVQNFDKPQLKFNLGVDTINLDRYLPPSEDVVKTKGQAGATAEALVVPMAMFNELAANGQFKAKQLMSGGIELNDVDVQITSTPGNVSIVPRANLYDGKMGGSMVFEQRGDTSKLHIKNELDLVSLAKFLQAADVTDQLSGIGTLGIDVTVTEKDGVQSNAGTIKLFAKNGAIKGVDIKGIVDNGYKKYNQLRGKETAAEEGKGDVNDETRFAELLGTFDVNNFIISNSDFSMKAPLFRITGEGDINIKAETVDYLVRVAVVNSSSGQGGEALEKLKGLTLPIRLRGSIFSPSYSLDMKALYTGLVKNEIEKKKAEYLEEKLGIESKEPLSSKEILQQALLNKLNKKNRNSQQQETITIESPNAAGQRSGESNKQTPEDDSYPQGTITIEPPSSNRSSSGANQRAAGATQQAAGAGQRAPDVSSDPAVDPSAEPAQAGPEDTRTKKQKRDDELKKLLLEGLFK